MNKTVNLIMTAVTAVILVGVNVGVLMAGNSGAIAPVENIALWGAFVALNIASILWGVSLLGLQPIVVAAAYVVGGGLAFLGVRDAMDVSVAEIITAGATYGAFGALAVGNATQKVRLAFFKKGQVPFVFIIIGLLVIDAGLNSGISKAGVNVIVKAVAVPFVAAGVGVGLVWSLLNRFGIGRKPAEVLASAEISATVELEKPAKAESKKAEPKNAAAKKSKPAKKAEPAKKAKPVAPVPVVAEKVPAPKPVIEKAPVRVEEEFVPLAIDEDERAAVMAVEEDNEPFEIPTFDASLYASGSVDKEENSGNVMVQEPSVAVDVDLDAIANVLSANAPKEEEKKEPVAAKKSDWLGGHLDLLDKIK